jgi:AraC-like DNA-binding protein
MLKPDFLRIHKGLEQLGVETGSLYRALGIRERDFLNEGRGVSMSLYLELLNLAAKVSDQPFLGASLGKISDPDDLGIMSYLIRNAPDFEGWTDLLSSYLHLVSPGAETGLIREGDRSILTYNFPSFTAELCRQDVEGTLVQYAETLRSFVKDKNWKPVHVYFQHSSPEDVDTLHGFLSEDMSFDHYFNGICFPTEFLFRPISHADPRLLSILEKQVKNSANRLGGNSDLLRELTLLISTSIGERNLSIDRVAPHVGMSRRTLHRRLAEQGTSFSELRDSVFARVSKEILSTTSASVTEIAHQLGYSDASAFNRAFKRLTGHAPLNYRRLHRTPLHK